MSHDEVASSNAGAHSKSILIGNLEVVSSVDGTSHTHDSVLLSQKLLCESHESSPWLSHCVPLLKNLSPKKKLIGSGKRNSIFASKEKSMQKVKGARCRSFRSICKPIADSDIVRCNQICF